MNEYDEQAGLDNNKIELLESKKTATSLNPYRIEDRSKEIVLTHIGYCFKIDNRKSTLIFLTNDISLVILNILY